MSGIDDRIKLRLSVVGVVVLAMFGVLVARLWFLQVLTGSQYANAAETNRVRIVSVAAPRGRILDDKGRVIVKNRTALAVGIRKDDLPKSGRAQLALKNRLAKLLGMTLKEINTKLADRRTSPYKPAVIATDVPQDVIFTIRERPEDFPGVETLTLPVRTYPYGTLAAQILGYVGETNDAELKKLKGYLLGDEIGRTGLESTYERYLRGRPGLEKLEVDASGRVLGTLGDNAPVPGDDVQLSIDAEVQKVAETALFQGIQRARSRTFPATGAHFLAPAGAAVVLDAKTGAVVAMASYPSYDPSKFVGGVSESYWSYLNNPANNYPLLNRTMQAAYPPGSTFKPILATAALATGAGSPGGSYPCQTNFLFGDRIFHNWQSRNAHISIAQSLIESCDTVYYNFAKNWWLQEDHQVGLGKKPVETMQIWARKFGLGASTGIDLPQETSGLIPGRAYRQSYWEANKKFYCDEYNKTKNVLYQDLCLRGYLWRGGDALNMSIGQGDVEATPLQMAVVYAAVANGGKVLVPHVAEKIVTPAGKIVKTIKPAVRARVAAPASAFQYVENALARVPVVGTATFPYRGWPFDRIPVAAKTGSAEIQGKQPFSWFASYAPAYNPKYVVVAVVEQAGFGSQVAGPVVRRIMDELFNLPPLPIEFGGRSD
ncbi:MAG: penicillin-binding protein 2 [Actinomycetota bacterium]